MRDGVSHLARVRLILVFDFFPRRLHREQHVGPGVAIGHREDVEGINGMVIGREPFEGGSRHTLEAVSITRRYLLPLANEPP